MIKILKYGEVDNDSIFARAVPGMNVEAVVTDIIDTVRREGDRALYAYCEKFDKCTLTALQVTQEEIDGAFAAVDPGFLEILRKAAANIRRFHERQVREVRQYMETAAELKTEADVFLKTPGEDEGESR